MKPRIFPFTQQVCVAVFAHGIRLFCGLLALAITTSTEYALAGDIGDRMLVEQLLERYRLAEDRGDLIGQSHLMSPDRIWIGPNGERRTDNGANIEVQQAQANAALQEVPGLQRFTQDTDVLIRFHGDGRVATVSFYRRAVLVHPAGTAPDLRARYAGNNETGTLVLEKLAGEWKIVHTHWSR